MSRHFAEKQYLLHMANFPSRFIFAAIASVALLPASVSKVSAEVFTGRVILRGSIVYKADTTEIAASLKGVGLSATSGDQINYNAGGVFASGSTKYLGSYSGKLRTIANNQGTIVRKKQLRPIRVTRRKIRFKDGVIRLKRPIRARELGTYRIRGRGFFKVSA